MNALSKLTLYQTFIFANHDNNNSFQPNYFSPFRQIFAFRLLLLAHKFSSSFIVWCCCSTRTNHRIWNYLWRYPSCDIIYLFVLLRLLLWLWLWLLLCIFLLYWSAYYGEKNNGWSEKKLCYSNWLTID